MVRTEGSSQSPSGQAVAAPRQLPTSPGSRTVDDYVALGTRENTRISYASAVRHFEVDWGGLLPATADSVARYLATYGASLAANTLQHRLSALSRWHVDQGFADPTKHVLVRQVLRGIRASQPCIAKRAKPLQIDRLQMVDQQLADQIQGAGGGVRLRLLRDRALLLLGFWRGFRGDELVHLLIENVQVTPGQGMVCYLSLSKGDREGHGRSFATPALSRLCPVNAFSDWIAAMGCTQGPVFRRIDRWGRIGKDGLHVDSLAPILRSILRSDGTDSQVYSTHSLRRGLANWAADNGWDIRNLMEYVGWRDMKTAMRYLDASPAAARNRIEEGLQRTPIPTIAVLEALSNDEGRGCSSEEADDLGALDPVR